MNTSTHELGRPPSQRRAAVPARCRNNRIHQLLSESRNGSNGFAHVYAYDDAGNRTTMSDGTTTTTYTYTPGNKLTLATAGAAVTTYLNDPAGDRAQLQAGAGNV